MNGKSWFCKLVELPAIESILYGLHNYGYYCGGEAKRKSINSKEHTTYIFYIIESVFIIYRNTFELVMIIRY